MFLFRQSEQRLYLVELVHVLALVEKYLAVGVVDDAFLDHGRGNDVVHLLRHHDCLTIILSHGLIHIAQIFSHVRRRESLPSLFHDKLFPHPFQTPHLVDEGFHDDDGHDGEQFAVFLN